MGLFSALIKIVSDTTLGIKYIGNDEKEEKAHAFLLSFKRYMDNILYISGDDKIKIVTAIITTGISAANADGKFTKSEGLELLNFMDTILNDEYEVISREEILELILTINDTPLDMEDLGNLAINLSHEYQTSPINLLRSFMEYIIYSDFEVQPKELEFLKNWDKTIELIS